MWSWFGKLLEISIQEHFFPIYVYQSFISYRELFLSFRISSSKRWLWNPMVSSILLERKRRWNEPVIRQTNFILCSLKRKHFFFLSYNLSFSPLTCSYFIHYGDQDMNWQMVLPYYIVNTAEEIITNTPTYTDMWVCVYSRKGTERLDKHGYIGDWMSLWQKLNISEDCPLQRFIQFRIRRRP